MTIATVCVFEVFPETLGCRSGLYGQKMGSIHHPDPSQFNVAKYSGSNRTAHNLIVTLTARAVACS